LQGEIAELTKQLEVSSANHQQTKDKEAVCQSKLLEASEKIKAAAIASEKAKQGSSECDKQVEKLHSEVTALSKKAH